MSTFSASPPYDPLDAAAIRAALGADAGRFVLRLVDTCASTNTELLQRPARADGAVEVLACEFQSDGRGRRGREWISSPGAGLTFSLRWRFDCVPLRLSGLSLAVGLAIVQALDELGVAGAALKWPNDVLADGRKLAGVLVELQSARDAAVAVIGIGMNVHGVPDAPAGLAPVALDALLAAPLRNRVLATVLRHLHATLEVFGRDGFAPLRDAWQARHAWQGHAVRIRADQGAEVTGECCGVDADGALLVRGDDGLHRILGGDVTLRTDD